MHKCWALSKVYWLAWWRTMLINGWAAFAGGCFLVVSSSLVYLEIGPVVVAAGLPGVQAVLRAVLLAPFLGFAFLDARYAQGLGTRGFPTWLPLTPGQSAAGSLLPGVIITAAVTSLVAVLGLARSTASTSVLVIAAIFLFLHTLLSCLLGHGSGSLALQVSQRLSDRLPQQLQSFIRVVLLLLFAAFFISLVFLPVTHRFTWLTPPAATSLLFFGEGIAGIIVGKTLAATALLATLTGLVVYASTCLRRGWITVERTAAASLLHGVRTFPKHHALAIAVLEVLCLGRDRSLIWYLIAVIVFFAAVVVSVGRGIFPLQHGPALLTFTIYALTFLLAAIPLRSRGRDLPTRWLWSSAPVGSSAYILGKYLTATVVPTVLLACLLATSAFLGDLRLHQGWTHILQVLRFGWAAYGLAFVWGVVSPHRDGFIAQEISQTTSYAISALLVFRVLENLEMLMPGSRWILPLALMVTFYSAALAAEERLYAGE